MSTDMRVTFPGFDASVPTDARCGARDSVITGCGARISRLASNLDPGFDPQSMRAASPLPTASALWPSCAQDVRTHQIIRT
jgi:hypothetical protein